MFFRIHVRVFEKRRTCIDFFGRYLECHGGIFGLACVWLLLLFRGHELPFLFDYNTKIRTISQYSQFKKTRTCFSEFTYVFSKKDVRVFSPSYTYILLFCQEAFFK